MLYLTLKIATTLLVAVVMALSLAHALELPGKMRLTREQYLAVQTIYYPGFTIGGASEPLSIVLLVVLLAVSPERSIPFWLTLAALAMLIVVQIIFWTMTQPVNRFWFEKTRGTTTADGDGAVHRLFGSVRAGTASPDWKVLRERWELSHSFRAIAALIATVLMVVAIAI
ncbi:MAG TPA: hypothetical protein VHW71_18415 [Steroidobacteraceae bacterium]|nr:hypothetical protein [Steroidobacteraceae bacterium]